jgi:glutathione S-transferase
MLTTIKGLRSTAVPFFIRPISRTIADRLARAWLLPNARQHLEFIDSLLATAPGGGPFLCGPELTAADIMISFPLLFAPERFDGEDSSETFWKWKDGKGVQNEFARVFEYLGTMKKREAWKRAEDKFGEVMGEA